jgi:sodium transport system ATP-binding protein
MIAAEDLYKKFGEKVAARGVSFTAGDGGITGLLGQNGAGKTTALRMIYGLLKPDRGAARVDGEDPARDPLAARRRLGILPDVHGLYPRLTAREHLCYFGELHGLSGRALNARAAALLEELDMGEIADRRAKGFSQGERMKVALGCALIHDPKNLLLDEPTRGLDVLTTRALRALLARLRGEGRCVVFSSHVMQEVTALCDRIVILAGGAVAAEGTPEELLAKAGRATLEEAFVALSSREVAS